MSSIKDLINQKFGQLTVIEDTNKRSKDGCCIWLCICSCGDSIEVSTKSLRNGHTKSCGCLNMGHYKQLSIGVYDPIPDDVLHILDDGMITGVKLG